MKFTYESKIIVISYVVLYIKNANSFRSKVAERNTGLWIYLPEVPGRKLSEIMQ